MSLVSFRIPAQSAQAESKAVVVVPRGYLEDSIRRWPVLYLLHGHGAGYTSYWTRFAGIGRPLDALADRFGLILVAADGKQTSWYLDAAGDVPGAMDWQYETVITGHLVPEVDRRFRTWSDPAGRGITGVSMGGHGALYLCARHPELFSACSGIAGIFDLTDTTDPQNLGRRLGPIEQHRDRWLEHSVITQAEQFAGRSTAVFFDCGWEDPFFNNNRALHLKLMGLKVPHDYIERPGGHTAEYWTNATPYHLQFMADRLRPAGRP